MTKRSIVPAIAASVLAASVLAASAALAAPIVENGYKVTRSQTVVPVPRGKLGRKTIDRETKVGVTEETDGNSSNFSMTLGGFVNKCPVPEGTAPVRFVVAGEFEYSLIGDTVDTNVVPTERKHYAKHVNLRLKAFVNDDLSITDGEFNGEYAADIEGVRTGPVPIHRRFRIGEGGMPDMEALKDIAVTSDIVAAALAWNASQVVLSVRPGMYEPNACAELQFDPPSESRTVGPGETVEIHVKYRSRDAQQPIPKGTWDAVAVGGGQVAEAGGQVRADGSFVVKYTARSSSDPKEGDGIRAEAGSAAGLAREHWKIRVGGDYELRFEHRIWDDRGTPGALVGNALFDGTVKFDVTLRPLPNRPGILLGTAAVVRQMQVGHVTPRCHGLASQGEDWNIVATVDAATKSLRLDASMHALDSVGEWTCVPGGRDDLEVDLSSDLQPFVMPATIGTTQNFVVRRTDGNHETITVTVLASPMTR